ncbi:putative receptor protein kinase ZmPK1 [Juglans regia]|uniref:Receptor-like serine/threonine-protein kinase n=2 Tax=Juglans regia TaxID=51240 RepID=A0A2I4DYJ2_JUGRE|nr:putative receptor protein kinase ZmPK1 [Juglans regia]
MDIAIFFLLLLLIKTPLLSSSSEKFDVLRGSSLSVENPSDKLVSLNGDFSAGFFPVGENAFCFAIWLTRSSAPTVVWMANRDDPVDGTGSQLSLSKDGKLRLTNSVGTTVWVTRTAASTPLESSKLQLQLQNTGNLVLNHSDQSGVIWQSFDSPTDTLLPQQTLTRISTLVSKSSKVDYSSGYYKLFFDNDNVLRLLYQGPVVSSLYWPDPLLSDPGLAGRSMYNSSRAAVLNESGYIWSSDHLEILATDFGVKTHRRLTLDRDGNLRLYSLEATNEGWDWVVTWQAVSDPCTIHGICGPNSVCSYDHASGRRCSCLQGFKIKDPTDWSFGCEADFNLPCNQSHEELSSFVQLSHADFFGNDIKFQPNVTLQHCENECLTTCGCKGFQFRFSADVYRGYLCYPKYELLNGRQTPNFEGDFYLKVPKAGFVYNRTLDAAESRLNCTPELSRQVRGTYENKTVKLLLWFATAVGGLEVTCIFLVLFFLFMSSKNSDQVAEGYLLMSRFKRFKFSELKKATRGFVEVIGRGGVGVVYKGILPDKRVAAIKRLDEANQGEAEFLAEVNIIGRLNHMNLIDIWGYCAEGKHRLLVYEFMEHGTLAEKLASNELDWKKRFDIAVGTAKGLAYLHEECLEWVLHCDVKPHNILLDSNYQPKVADFGLSKLLNRSEHDHSSFSKMRGTRGYMAPEWVYNLPITSKVDVYSYGIVVLEMVTGKSPTGTQHSSGGGGAKEHTRLDTLVREKIMHADGEASRESWNIEEIVDPGEDKDKMELLLKVALQCVAEDKDDRPAMTQVVEMLRCKEVN